MEFAWCKTIHPGFAIGMHYREKPPSGEASIDSTNATGRKNRGEKDDGEPGEYDHGSPSSDFAALIHTIEKEGIAYRKEEQREDRGKKLREWVTIGLIALTFGAVCWQVHEMIKVYEPIREQAEAAEKSASAAAAQATAAKTQADAMTKQTETSARAIVAADRAWVGPEGAHLESKPAVGQKNKIIVQYQNTGKEPAIGFVYAAFPFVVTVQEDASGKAANTMFENMQKCINTPPALLAGVVFPTSGFTSGNLFTPIDGALIDQDVVDSKKFLILQGCFAYQTDNVVHHSAFCFFYKVDQTDIGNLNICRSGNYAD